MKKSILIVLTVVIVAVILGIALWTNPSPAVTPAAENQTPAAAPAQTLTMRTDPNLGTYLAATNGMTLYVFTKDTPSVSTCSDTCITNWPPYIVGTAALSAPATVPGALTTLTRPDGSFQLTYNGAPLYFWHNDTKPGDTTGDNVGGVWFVAKP